MIPQVANFIQLQHHPFNHKPRPLFYQMHPFWTYLTNFLNLTIPTTLLNKERNAWFKAAIKHLLTEVICTGIWRQFIKSHPRLNIEKLATSAGEEAVEGELVSLWDLTKEIHMVLRQKQSSISVGFPSRRSDLSIFSMPWVHFSDHTHVVFVSKIATESKIGYKYTHAHARIDFLRSNEVSFCYKKMISYPSYMLSQSEYIIYHFLQHGTHIRKYHDPWY